MALQYLSWVERGCIDFLFVWAFQDRIPFHFSGFSALIFIPKRKRAEPERRDAGPGRCLRGLYESHSEPVSFSAPHSSPAGQRVISPQLDGQAMEEGVCTQGKKSPHLMALILKLHHTSTLQKQDESRLLSPSEGIS